MNIKIKLLHGGKTPTRGSRESAGYDLYVVEDDVLKPFEIRTIRTGICVKTPAGDWFDIRGRSSTFTKRGLMVMLGTIDPDYIGEMRIQIFNLNNHEVYIHRGERLAQLVLNGLDAGEPIEWELVNDLEKTERGKGGFGSTGV